MFPIILFIKPNIFIDSFSPPLYPVQQNNVLLIMMLADASAIEWGSFVNMMTFAIEKN